MTVKQRREEVSMSMNLEMLKAQLSQEEIAFKQRELDAVKIKHQTD